MQLCFWAARFMLRPARFCFGLGVRRRQAMLRCRWRGEARSVHNEKGECSRETRGGAARDEKLARRALSRVGAPASCTAIAGGSLRQALETRCAWPPGVTEVGARFENRRRNLP